MFKQKELGVVELKLEYRDNIPELKISNDSGFEKIFKNEEARILFMSLMGYEDIEIIYDEEN